MVIENQLIYTASRATRTQLFARLIFAVILSLFAGEVVANSKVAEYKVKAAFLYNFAKFVEWPNDEEDSNIAVCSVGVDPFGVALDAIDNKSIGDAHVNVRRMQWPSNIAGCNIVFISASEQAYVHAIISSIQGKPILTVSDTPGFLEQGGMIMLHMEGAKVRFSVNMIPIHDVNMHVSGHLLRLARKVISKEEGVE